MRLILRIFELASILTITSSLDSSPSIRIGTVYKNGNEFVFRPDTMDKENGAAYGFYNDTILKTGWGVLEIHNGGGSQLQDNDRLFAAGYLEGVFTARAIIQNANNMKAFWSRALPGPKMNQAVNWLVQQDTWARSYVKSNQDDPLARTTGYLLSQFDGLLEGVQNITDSNRFSKEDLLVLVNTGDLIDLSSKFSEHEVDFDSMSPLERRQYVHLGGMCSALVKVTPGFENIFMSHVSWFTYSATLRIYKHYIFDIKDPGVSTGKISFSSYAGYLSSLDDFYILGSNMVMLQTTNGIFNKSLYDLITPSALVSWQRIRSANYIASDGKTWADIVGKYNSGTYNNQYMVIDLKRVHLNSQLNDGTLTIVEQIPGLVEWSDQTAVLSNGHWPSYNVPFHEKIYNKSGYPEFVARYGVEYSYQMAPRAKLFRRDADKVTTFEDMQRLMRSNNYKSDPYSDGDPSSAICARGDLIVKNPSPDGCYDGKVTDMKMAHSLMASIISGPTTSGNTLKPFSWDTPSFQNQPHEGLPPVYNFNWTLTAPML